MVAWLAATAVAAIAAPPSVSHAADHPAVQRFKGAVLIGRSETPFERLSLELGPTYFDKQERRGRTQNSQAIEGRVWRSVYVAPATTTAFEVFRNYSQALETSGFHQLYACEAAACGAISHGSIYLTRDGPAIGLSGFRFLNTRSYFVAAGGGTAEKPLFVLIMIDNYRTSGSKTTQAGIYQLIIEPRQSQLGQVVVDGAALAQQITAEGRAAVYGLYFDSGSSELKTESRPQLQQLAAYLSSNLAASVIVVGHTDSQGGLEPNLSLSQRRADAVVSALVGEYGIGRQRLTAKGVGMLAPVASNREPNGRSRNRRVEIVERLAN
ncbi:MAG: OmpA family protein [Proteobacteria bacterium]|nr:OmpA family protein [Pseudomonadota bacterium]